MGVVVDRGQGVTQLSRLAAWRAGNCRWWARCDTAEATRRVASETSGRCGGAVAVGGSRGGSWSVGAAGICGMGVPGLIGSSDDRAAVKAT